MQVQHAPRSDRARRRSRAQGDRLVSPRRAETRRKAAPARASAAPSSLASAANRVRATESPFAKAINGLLQQNRPQGDMSGLGVVQRRLTIALMPTTFADTHHLDGGSIFDPSRPSICPRILTWNDFAPSTNSMRTVRDEVGTTRVLDGPGKRIGLS